MGESTGEAAFDTIPYMVESRPPISPEDAAAYLQRWAIAGRRLTQELRDTPMETKLHRLAALMASAPQMGWSGSFDEEDDAVRERWMALRRAELGRR